MCAPGRKKAYEVTGGEWGGRVVGGYRGGIVDEGGRPRESGPGRQGVSNVRFRCRIAHSSFSHSGFTLPVIEKGLRSCSEGIYVCVYGSVLLRVFQEGRVNSDWDRWPNQM